MVCATSKVSDQPPHTQSDQSLCLSLEYSMTVKLLTEHLGVTKRKGAAQARLSLHLSNYHIVGNHMSRLNYRLTKMRE